jgi:2-oxoglutarate dehydrogenase E2 component (dihydrolipoamide succinyltransferase)
MSTSVLMPRLGESVTEGTVTRWLRAEGDSVDLDEPLLEVSTDKVDTEVPSPVAGVLRSIKVAEDETVEVGAELAIIDDAEQDGEPPSGSSAASGATHGQKSDAAPLPAPGDEPALSPVSAPAPTTSPPSDVGAPAGRFVTPLVRRLAVEQGVDLASVQGTGAGGRIRKSDVLAAAGKHAETAEAEPELAVRSAADGQPDAGGQPAAAPPKRAAATAERGSVVAMSRLRQVIASRMVESVRTSAQLTTVVEVDVTQIARLREAAKRDFEAREGVKLSFLPFFAVAAIEALKAHPIVNASMDPDAKTISYHGAEHLGIAVDTERGLLVPVVHNAGDLNLAGLARKVADLAERTRANKVAPDELGGGTFTLTNTGSRGALFDTPIINQPQVGILGTGSVVKRPVVVTSQDLGETIAIRSMVYLALSYDHRIVDGADAARFLVTMKQRLEAGAFERALGLP